MRHLLLSILSLLLMLPCSAADTLTVKSNFKAGELIMPLSLIGAGTLGFVEPVKSACVDFQGYVNSWRGEPTTIDDYLQYVPLASVYG